MVRLGESKYSLRYHSLSAHFVFSLSFRLRGNVSENCLAFLRSIVLRVRSVGIKKGLSLIILLERSRGTFERKC